MKIDKAAIKAFLATHPAPGDINTIVTELTEYLKEYNRIEALWQQQLPSKEWGDLSRRQQFRDIFKCLLDQGISICYNSDISSTKTHYWRLRKGKEEAGLTWNMESEKWILYHFKLLHKNGNSLDGFEYVDQQLCCP